MDPFIVIQLYLKKYIDSHSTLMYIISEDKKQIKINEKQYRRRQVK